MLLSQSADKALLANQCDFGDYSMNLTGTASARQLNTKTPIYLKLNVDGLLRGRI